MRQSLHQLLKTKIECVLLFSGNQKSFSREEAKSWDINNKCSANVKEKSKFPYKIATCHKLTDIDKQRRTEMCSRTNGSFSESDKVWFANEANFHLDGAVNHPYEV